MSNIVSAQVFAECSLVLNRELESIRLALFSEIQKMRARGKQKHELRVRYGKAIRQLQEFSDWVCSAKPGERRTYAELPCLLMVARNTDVTLDHLANFAHTLYRRGLLSLYSQKVAEGHWRYGAARSGLGFVPKASTGGIAGSTPSPVNFDLAALEEGKRDQVVIRRNFDPERARSN